MTTKLFNKAVEALRTVDLLEEKGNRPSDALNLHVFENHDVRIRVKVLESKSSQDGALSCDITHSDGMDAVKHETEIKALLQEVVTAFNSVTVSVERRCNFVCYGYREDALDIYGALLKHAH